jgi:hypothetical protein
MRKSLLAHKRPGHYLQMNLSRWRMNARIRRVYSIELLLFAQNFGKLQVYVSIAKNYHNSFQLFQIAHDSDKNGPLSAVPWRKLSQLKWVPRVSTI